jgi:hypothetical protein
MVENRSKSSAGRAAPRPTVRATWVPLAALVAAIASSTGAAASGHQCIAAAITSSTGAAASGRQCVDPCLQAARESRKECASSATGAFQDALDGCLERDHTCIEACRADRQDCRDATSLGQDVVACQIEQAAAQEQCRQSFPLGSKRRAACLFQAEVEGSRCNRRALLGVHVELKQCRTGFNQCAQACAPGEPPGGVGPCRSEGRTAFKSTLAECRLEYQVTASACINRDLGCVQDCGEARETCNAPTNATLDDAIAACNAQAKAAIAACAQANPNGGAALDQCIQTAQANSSACRDAALQAAAPALASCAEQYLACVRACPAP